MCCHAFIVLPLRHSINCSLITRMVLYDFRIAKVPMYEIGKRDDPYVYLPVSMLPIFKKTPEKLIANRLFTLLK